MAYSENQIFIDKIFVLMLRNLIIIIINTKNRPYIENFDSCKWENNEKFSKSA